MGGSSPGTGTITARNAQVPGDAALGAGGLIAIVGFMFMLTAMSIDMMIPALIDLTAAFGRPSTDGYAVITWFMVGYALPHLVMGPLSDRFGRKPVLIGGLLLYMAGGLACLFAQNFDQLLMARLVQGTGAASGPLIGRAVLRDRFQGEALARAMAVAMVFFASGPMLAPIIGALVLLFAGWNAIFGVLVAAGLFFLLAVLFLLPETRDPATVVPLSVRRIAGDIAAVLKLRETLAAIAALSLAYALLALYLSSTALIYMAGFGLTETQFAATFAVIAAGTIVAKPITSLVLRHRPPHRALIWALMAQLAVTFCLLVQFGLGWATLPGTVFTFALVFVAFTATLSIGTALALSPHGPRAGTASGVMGLCQLLTGAFLGGWLAALTGGDGLWVATAMVALAAAAAIAHLWITGGCAWAKRDVL